jgi:hypothetical protein
MKEITKEPNVSDGSKIKQVDKKLPTRRKTV